MTYVWSFLILLALVAVSAGASAGGDWIYRHWTDRATDALILGLCVAAYAGLVVLIEQAVFG